MQYDEVLVVHWHADMQKMHVLGMLVNVGTCYALYAETEG